MSKQVLLLEDDVVMQELLATLVRALSASVRVHIAENLEAGIEVWHRESIDLLLCDWNLGDRHTGLELVKLVRQENADVPIIMITGQSDRQTVAASLRYRVNEYIVKPFEPQAVALRLSRYLTRDSVPGAGGDSEAKSPAPELSVWLADIEDLFERLSIMSGTQSAVTLLDADQRPSVRDLARLWEADPAITTRLLRLANSSLMRRYGKSVNTLLEAVGTLGVDMAVSQVIATALNDKQRLEHAYLRQLADHYAEETGRIAERAATLAQQLKLNIALSYTAGLMTRLGEQALLDAIQQYLHAGGSATLSDMDLALAKHASRYGNYLKIKWHLPLALRERAGATYKLPDGAVNPELILMRLAASEVRGDATSDELERLRRTLGL